ncbi:TatD family [Gamsiella multidivaricata]|uniref:TatD family n=1 Tax=Gamsiella multidivaricata TaxID=101098 RepID=UPI002220934A|nr:TatD family [Gamsiella multidivaricata]KAI7815934.1 TatD family [Gamsiella multidivaricata]
MCGGGKHDAQQQQPGGETLAFPGHLYSQLTDAHCHIQDDRQNINSLVHSWSSSSDKSTSSDATVAPLLTGKVCLMGVQPSKDLGLPVQDDGSISISTAALSLNSSSKVLGLPTSASEEYLRDLSKRLPEPRALEPALKELRRQLEAHPHAVVGEIGLDRTARVPEPSIPSSSSTTATTTAGCDNGDKEKKDPNQKRTTLALTSIQHQLDIVREQLKLAASLNRAVSFHCVQAYGHWHDFLIQEGRRLKQMEAGNDYQLQLQQIHASGGTAAISPISPSGIRLSKKSAARLRKEARDAAWERHVASTLQESSDEDEDDEESGDDKDESRSGDDGSKSVASSTLNAVTMTTTTAAGTSGTDESTVAPKYEPVLPPRLCMHSYGGSIDMLKAFTKLDHPPEIFFSFSILINGRLQEKKLRELILAVPEDRLLIESDHHSHTQVDRLLVEMASKVAEIRGWTIEKTVERSARNWQRFVYG